MHENSTSLSLEVHLSKDKLQKVLLVVNADIIDVELCGFRLSGLQLLVVMISDDHDGTCAIVPIDWIKFVKNICVGEVTDVQAG